MSESQRTHGFRLLSELIVVFLGVVVALGADSWWGGSKMSIGHSATCTLCRTTMACKLGLERARTASRNLLLIL